MEELSLHIEYLLLWHDCVIVPGVGAFIAGRRGAQIDHADGKILPPCREIAFNREVMTDDGLLAHSVARRESLTFEEGRLKMQAAIAEIKEHLLNEREVTLGHVGTLLLGEEGTIEFHPFRRAEAGAAAVGMYEASMVYKPVAVTYPAASAATEQDDIESATTEVADDVIKADEGYAVPSQESDEDIQTSTETSNRKSSPYYIIRIRKTYAHIAACLVLIAVLAVSLIIPSTERTTDKTFASVVPVSAIAKTQVEKAEKPKSEIAEAQMAKEEPAETPSETAFTEKDALLPYYLIVATFRSRQEAEDFIEDAPYGDQLTCVEGRKLFRVAIAGSDNKETLQAQLNSNTFKNKYPGGWIWKSKK